MKLTTQEIEILIYLINNHDHRDKETIDKLKSIFHSENINILEIEINYINPSIKEVINDRT